MEISLVINGWYVRAIGGKALLDGKLSLRAKGLYSLLMCVAQTTIEERDSYCNRLYELTSDSTGDIKAAFAELRKSGYIVTSSCGHQVFIEKIGGEQNASNQG